jgi:hypothetical protein
VRCCGRSAETPAGVKCCGRSAAFCGVSERSLERWGVQREVRYGGCAAPCEAQGTAKLREQRGSHVQSPLLFEIRHSGEMEIVSLESFEREDVRRFVGAVGGGAVPFWAREGIEV